ncbi:MAG TPA: hypothetical protein VL793_05880 [Patescibacteria group bacterium]|nr:hypothetical protein [Patescibacteria group bacterium]
MTYRILTQFPSTAQKSAFGSAARATQATRQPVEEQGTGGLPML